MDSVALLTVLILAGFTGYEVIGKVSSTLHTPLMSGSNAISGIILVGTIVIAVRAQSPVVLGLALPAVVLATINLVGGFVVTDRMLRMFRGRDGRGGGNRGSAGGGGGRGEGGRGGGGRRGGGRGRVGGGRAGAGAKERGE